MTCCQHTRVKHITTVLCHGNNLDQQMSQFYEITVTSPVTMVVLLLDIKFKVRVCQFFKVQW
jgi:hypothetical protein